MIDETLEKVKKVLEEYDIYEYAYSIIDFDRQTVCPDKGMTESGETCARLEEVIFNIKKDPSFIEDINYLYENRNELGEFDRAAIERLRLEFVRRKNITPEMAADSERIKNAAWIAWNEARAADDFRIFEKPLEKLVENEKARVMLWDTADDPQTAKLSAYERMLDEHEDGMRQSDIDALFEPAAQRISELIRHIKESPVMIRRDFLSRRVTGDQQRQMTVYLLSLLGFDFSRGTYTTSEHPFMNRVGRDDIRVTTHFYDDNFISGMYSIIHECGHALFEQLQPRENQDAHLDVKTMGQHESVSRMYENIIGRSKDFIGLIYPKVCEIFPQVMYDVTAEDLYEAVNIAEPSLIRTEADELTYTLHIVIRYEIEKRLIDGDLKVSEIPALWKKLYKDYLGIEPSGDFDGALQDVHWTSDFGYFPAYALGNFYGAMYYNRMCGEIDVPGLIRAGDFTAINKWMSDNVFVRADRLTPREWIKDITGRDLTADDFLDYLDKKYSEVYMLAKQTDENARFEGYVRSMARVRLLSAPLLDNLGSAEDYGRLLIENFMDIRGIAGDNRDVMREFFEPILDSDDELPDEMIEAIREMNAGLQDAFKASQLDVPMVSLFSDRLKKDAIKKGDEAYLIKQLDSEIENCYFMINISTRIFGYPQVADHFREKGIKAFNEIIGYLEKDRFEKLDEECREIVIINSRYGQLLYEDMSKVPEERNEWRLKVLRRSEEVSNDPWYRERVPEMDWNRQKYKIHEYFSMMGVDDNAIGLTRKQLEETATHADALMKMYEQDPDIVLKYTYPEYIQKIHAINHHNLGEISDTEFIERIEKLHESADPMDYTDKGIDKNVSMPIEMLLAYAKTDYGERGKDHIRNLYRSVISYAFHMPKMGLLGSLLGDYAVILDNYIEVPGSLTFEEMGMQSFAAFHPPTYVHSNMVAHISSCLAENLIRRRPDLFVGICGCDSEAEVTAAAQRIADFVYHAALCHDFGKLCIMDTIFIYGRKLLDHEFETIKYHPLIGYNMLKKHESTAEYADIALGHHIWYDGTRGYPDEFDIRNSLYKTVIDIVECADCMDAATDTVGRSYTSGKTLEEFTAEVRAAAGTRYAPYIADLIEEEAVADDLSYLLSEGRKEIYRKTYMLLKSVQEKTE